MDVSNNAVPGYIIKDSDEIDLSRPAKVHVTHGQDQQRDRYLERFQERTVNIEQTTRRFLKMCGQVRDKSLKANKAQRYASATIR